MWVCFNDSFASAVQDIDYPDRLVVRYRDRAHLERLFPNAEILTIPSRDYRFRIFVTKTAFAEIITRRVHGIDYSNFKDSVSEGALHDLYLEFWLLHRRYQDRHSS